MEHEKLTQLPLSRIRTVMKTSPNIGSISPDALHLVCRAAEMFIEHMSKNAYKKGNKSLDYKHLANYVESLECMEFLGPILPKKITVREYKKVMENKRDTDDDSSSSSEEESGSDEEESGEEGSEESSEEDEPKNSGTKEEPEDDAISVASSSVISIGSSSSDEKENSKNMSNKKSPLKHKTGDSP
ncbi:chromatin accessibility complex protein 1 [Uranotaenia lowii]|uniref:chromatin accessibility complex protein 1 n=1 Tax=Uranotaenia lowii TaxID=190385 RepID=UPI002478B220|nr:chromatin accessibility complex protein 1 [Uranotaenia lowii]